MYNYVRGADPVKTILHFAVQYGGEHQELAIADNGRRPRI